MNSLEQTLISARVLPVLLFDSEQQAVAVCRALSAGGMTAVEITLRTPAALQAIRAVKQQCPELVVAAGTVLTVRDMEEVKRAGADFAVSPGATRLLCESARALAMDFLPGVSTASDILNGMEMGHRMFKFFPAEASGGVAVLKAFASPFAGISFCPTGGIHTANARDYLTLGNVRCVGGSWMIDSRLVQQQRWSEISTAASQCLRQLASTE